MTNIEVARQVAATKQAHQFRERKNEPGQYDAKEFDGRTSRGWTVLDGFSASAICTVFDALKPENQVKFTSLSLPKMASVAFKMLK